MTLRTTMSFLFFLCSLTLTAQKITFRKMDVLQGLPSSEVYNLHQDKKGYIWAFTEYGIVKHNGTKFIPVCKNLPPNESAIYKVTESPDGIMYIANSNAKIYRIAGDSAIQLKGLEKVSAEIANSNKTIIHLAIDQKLIWFASTVKSYQYNLKKHRVNPSCLHKKTGLITFQTIGTRDIALKCMHIKGQKEKCLLSMVNDSKQRVFSIPFLYMFSSRNGIIRNTNRYYIMAWNELLLVERKGIVKRQKFNRPLLSIELAPDGHVWQGLSYDGLYELDANLNQLHHYLPGLTISDILFDNQGGIWVSTIERGVFYCPSRRYTYYDEIPELSGSITLLKVIDKQLFIGTADGNLFIYANKRLLKVPRKKKDICVNDVIRNEGDYLVGTKSGIYKLYGSLDGYRTINVCTKFGGYGFAEQRNKQLLLVSASNVLEKSPESNQFSNRLFTQNPRHIAARKDGAVFISTRKGVFLFNNKKLVMPAYLKMLRGKNVARLSLDGKENLWICTIGNGLFRLSPDNVLIRITGLPSSVVTDICFLHNKNAVIASNKGAFISSMTSGDFGSWVQLAYNEVSSVEAFDGKLYLGTKLGLTILNTEGLLKKTVYPFYLESVFAGKRKICPVNIKLRYDENNLCFNFDLLAYSANEKCLFYTLKGPSPEKGKITGNQLNLQNLRAGHYKLLVYPDNYLKNKHQKVWKTSFYIAPAFWHTRIFLAVIIILFATLIVLITRFVLRRIRKKTEAREQVTRMLTIYRLTALKAQINPHFISNSLAAIQELIITDQTDKANQYLARFSLLIRYLLNYSDQSVASIADELKIIEIIIELEQLRFSNQFVFRKEIAEDIALENLFIPPLITQPFIENAIWHGLLPLKGKRIPELLLKIVLKEEQLIISIIDNGVGRRDAHTKNRTQHESKGNELIQRRIENLNKLHETKGASIILTDLEDQQGEPAGVRVDIIFQTDMLNTLYDEQNQEYYY